MSIAAVALVMMRRVCKVALLGTRYTSKKPYNEETVDSSRIRPYPDLPRSFPRLKYLANIE